MNNYYLLNYNLDKYKSLLKQQKINTITKYNYITIKNYKPKTYLLNKSNNDNKNINNKTNKISNLNKSYEPIKSILNKSDRSIKYNLKNKKFINIIKYNTTAANNAVNNNLKKITFNPLTNTNFCNFNFNKNIITINKINNKKIVNEHDNNSSKNIISKNNELLNILIKIINSKLKHYVKLVNIYSINRNKNIITIINEKKKKKSLADYKNIIFNYNIVKNKFYKSIRKKRKKYNNVI